MAWEQKWARFFSGEYKVYAEDIFEGEFFCRFRRQDAAGLRGTGTLLGQVFEFELRFLRGSTAGWADCPGGHLHVTYSKPHAFSEEFAMQIWELVPPSWGVGFDPSGQSVKVSFKSIVVGDFSTRTLRFELKNPTKRPDSNYPWNL